MRPSVIILTLPQEEYRTIRQIRQWISERPSRLADAHIRTEYELETNLENRRNAKDVDVHVILRVNDAEITVAVKASASGEEDEMNEIYLPVDQVSGRYSFDVIYGEEENARPVSVYIAPESGFEPMKAFRTTEDDPDTLYLVAPEYIGPDDWQRIAGEFHKCGYDIKDGEDAAELFTRSFDRCGKHGYPMNNDQRDAIYDLFQPKSDVDRTPQHPYSVSEYEIKALKTFGEANHIRNAGYVTPHGHLLNFSYEGCQRDMDHREIADIMPDGLSGTEAMMAFMNMGNVRLGNGTADMTVRPTHQQKDALKRALLSAIYNADTFTVEMRSRSGCTVESKTYTSPDQRDELIADIDRYFDTGYIDPIDGEEED